MRPPIPITRDRPMAAPPDPPVGVGATQVSGAEVIDTLVLLYVALAVGEDEMRVDADGARGGFEPRQKSRPEPTRYVVDSPARVHEIEPPLRQISRGVGMYPMHLDAGAPRQAPGFTQTRDGNRHGRHLTAAAREENAVPPLAAPDLEHSRPWREQRAQHAGERRRGGPQDVVVWSPGEFQSPWAPGRHGIAQPALAMARPCRSTSSSISLAGSTGARLRIRLTAAFSSPSALGSSGSPPRLRPTAARTIPSFR